MIIPSSVLVIIGATYFLQKRLKDPGLIATQTFEGDILPLLLLILVSLTGLGLTLDYEFMHGKAYEFIAVTHAFFVIIFIELLGCFKSFSNFFPMNNIEKRFHIIWTTVLIV